MSGSLPLYFISESVGCAVTLAVLAPADRIRRSALTVGLTMVIAAPLSVLHDGTYWTPTRLLGGPFGVEDPMFAWRFALLAMVAALWPWRHDEIRCPTDPRVGEVAILALVGAIVFGLLTYAADRSVMPAFLAAQATVAVVLQIRHPDLRRPALRAATILSAIHALHLAVAVTFVPGFASMWQGSQPYWATFAGIPIEEVVWAATFGACVPPMWAVATGWRPAKVPSITGAGAPSPD
jgi:hypothetical protein